MNSVKNITLPVRIILTVITLLVSGIAHAEITNHIHDFSNYPGSKGEVCIFCHTPHSASSDLIPLWNHATTTKNFTPYSSATLNASVGQPSASSKACLSCHDGTIAVDSYGGKTGTKFVYSSVRLDSTMKNDHPVSFVYDSALATADGELEDPAVKTVGVIGGKTIDAGMLIDHKLECASCHDVHADKGVSATSDYLLVVTYENSDLCLTCHKK